MEGEKVLKKDISSLHVPHNKHTAACEPVRIETPKEVVLPMNMHSGHDAEPIVKVGDYVKVRITGCSSATLFGEVVE